MVQLNLILINDYSVFQNCPKGEWVESKYTNNVNVADNCSHILFFIRFRVYKYEKIGGEMSNNATSSF